jgi:hypothetical protein
MTSPGLWRRLGTALGAALKRGILGRSTHEYMQQFTGGDAYWDRVIAAQRGRHQRSVRDTAPCPPEPEYEPVHGWTKSQCDDYLARNPGYRSTYEAALQKRCQAAVPGVNGSSPDWFGLRRSNHDKAASNTEPNGAK